MKMTKITPEADDDTVEVICTCCKRSFPGFAPSQANDCAADLVGDTITGHYGSSIADLTHFRFLNGRPAGLTDGVICDSCILAFLEAKTLVRSGEYHPFEGVWGFEFPDNLVVIEAIDEEIARYPGQ